LTPSPEKVLNAIKKVDGSANEISNLGVMRNARADLQTLILKANEINGERSEFGWKDVRYLDSFFLESGKGVKRSDVFLF
jgi:hypothetical protein